MKHFKSFFKDVWNYVKVWRELSSIVVGFILWMKSHILLRWIDPTSATYDAGIFQIILFAVIALFVLHGVVRILMKLIWPTTDNYLDNEFATDFKTLESWQKLKLTTSIFFAFLFAAVLLARVL
ncbi:hypothetical protein JMN32_05315 [Fulvivirga sp. 29W222]|uniref:Uncharacterized protein n=1 Tax=Fulvivirga marina TaxID=2494733 RepID=A0A937FVI5_9BACT|nr:hypothetical protein [Fulvivirga marina]MBL6445717.1 hypothetical protein [Fulvivirga marina]